MPHIPGGDITGYAGAEFGDDFPVTPTTPVAKIASGKAVVIPEADKGRYDFWLSGNELAGSNRSERKYAEGKKAVAVAGTLLGMEELEPDVSKPKASDASREFSESEVEFAKKGLDYLDDSIRTNSSLAAAGESLPAKEGVRRQADVRRADDALMEGREAYAKGDYEAPFAAGQKVPSWLGILDVRSVDSIPFYGEDDGGSQGQKATVAKLNQIIIPELNFENTTVEEALEFLQLRTTELDSSTLDSADQGVDFSVKAPKVLDDEFEGEEVDGLGSAVDPKATIIKNLNLKDVPVDVALRYIADAAKLRYEICLLYTSPSPRDRG